MSFSRSRHLVLSFEKARRVPRVSTLGQRALLAAGLLGVGGVVLMLGASQAEAQTNISGDLTGSVSDASGAAVAGATVTVTNVDTQLTKTATTGGAGEWRVPLLSPGRYKVSVSAAGFGTADQETVISAGVNSTVSTKLAVGNTAVTVEVSGNETPLLHTDDAQISTTFNLQQIQNLPNPGNDLTFVAQTTPGAVMNTQAGYGNFSVNGLPGTSNTFTMNGGYEGDPYLNLNNSGATNLLLGNNDVESVTVTTNAYDAAFGGLGGAQVNEISRSGTNKWHGNAAYWWNGRILNANDTLNKQSGTPRQFDNANQWAASIGGPLRKDKIFGFIDTEGLRVLIPSRGTSYGPSPAYQAAILQGAPIAPTSAPSSGSDARRAARVRGARVARPNDATTDPNSIYAPYGNLAYTGLTAEAPLYQTIFNYYNNAPGFAQGSQDPADPDTWIWDGQATSFAQEWLINGRLDFNLSDNDHVFIHFKDDHGVQPTQVSFLNPLFSAFSPQPSYEGQLDYTHTFTSNVTNQFLFAASYYRAIFSNPGAQQAAASVPFVLVPEGSAETQGTGDWDASGNTQDFVGGANYAFPQGRNVTGYQFNDDLNWQRGKHAIKVGYTFRRDDVTDYTSSEHVYQNGGAENYILDQGDFAAGYSDEWAERFPLRLTQPVALYVMGGYLQDQYKPIPNLTITYGLRLEHNANPTCQTNCVTNFGNDFSSLSTDTTTAYSQLLASGRHRAFFSQQDVAWEPRVGFAWQPGGTDSKTTVRGGFGMFSDYFPAQIMGDLLSNVPTVDRFTVLGEYYAATGQGGNVTQLDPSTAGSGHQIAIASNAALQTQFAAGGNYQTISQAVAATGGTFSRPTVVGTARQVHLPTYEEYSLAVERELSRGLVVAVNYVGNHGYHEPVQVLPNAFDAAGSIAGLPTSRPNPSFNSVTEYYSGATSNYNGAIVTASSHWKWVSYQLNYAFSHALDECSNGCFNAFGVNPIGQINPANLHENYGNADYDTRHYVSANYTVQVPTTHRFKAITGGWEVSGTTFHNSGYPFSVIDSTGDVTYGTAPLAQQLDNHFNHKCGGLSHTQTPCDFASHFAPATGYGQQARNQLYGPSFTDTDFDVAKSFAVPRWETAKFRVAAQFFNAFNHANFQIPASDVESSQNGVIQSTASVPTSILGAFLGGDASPRLIQFKGVFEF